MVAALHTVIGLCSINRLSRQILPVIAISVALTPYAICQSGPWQSGSGVIYETDSNVGIGTTAPVTALHVNGVITAGNSNSTAGSVILGGYYGGTTSVLAVWGSEYSSGAPVMGYGVEPSTSASGSFLSSYNAILPRAALTVGGSGSITFYTGGSQTVAPGSPVTMTPVVTILNGGNVGIGTATPEYPLSVNGTIQAKEVIVNTNWSDYVFDGDYRLPPLSEVATYVNENHHLPGIPSAQEVKEKGISLGDMQAKLLAKIEELTLHMIAADRENRELRERISHLESSAGQSGAK